MPNPQDVSSESVFRRSVSGSLGALASLRRSAVAKAKRIASDLFGSTPLYCKALAGESDYNICVNSDLTVSCNCQDFDCQGHIGDLRVQTLAEIFAGETVRRFQADLALRKLPTRMCRSCPELTPIPPERRGRGPIPGGIPVKGLMVENTSLCNLRCGLCRREELLAGRRQHSMSLEDVAEVAAMIAEYGIELVSYYNLGEPFLSRTIRAEVATLRERSPDLRIVVSTNGALMDTDDKIDAALMMDYVYFSIDGVSQATLERYQVRGDFERSYSNMRRLVQRRSQRLADDRAARVPTIEWKYVLFSWNDQPEHVERALDLARQAGVDRIVFYPGATERRNRSLRFYSDPFFTASTNRLDGGVVVDFADSRYEDN